MQTLFDGLQASLDEHAFFESHVTGTHDGVLLRRSHSSPCGHLQSGNVHLFSGSLLRASPFGHSKTSSVQKTGSGVVVFSGRHSGRLLQRAAVLTLKVVQACLILLHKTFVLINFLLLFDTMRIGLLRTRFMSGEAGILALGRITRSKG